MNADHSRRERDALFKLHQINRAMSEQRDMEKLLHLIMDHAIELTRAERGFLIQKKADGSYEVMAGRNIGREAIDHPMFKVSRGIIDECWKTGQPIILDDAKSDDSFRTSTSVANLALASVVCVPLKRDSRMTGALYLDNRFRKGLFHAADMLILETFADEAASAIENARLISQIERQRLDLEEANRKLKSANQHLEEEVKKKESQIEQLETKIRLRPPKW